MFDLHGYFTLGRCQDCGKPSLVYVTRVDEQGLEYGNSLFCFDKTDDAEEALGFLAEQLQGLLKRYRLLETKDEEMVKVEVPKIFLEAFKENR